MTITLRLRLRRIEAKHHHGERPLAATFIRSGSDEDRSRQLVEHMAAGTYRPGRPLIICQGTTQP